MGVSAAAGAAVGLGAGAAAWLWAVPPLYLARMALNAMDGMLAREYAMVSPRGVVLNELGDVVSDAVAYLPFALLVPDAAPLVVAVVVLGLIAEVAALAAADDSGRRNDGPLGKSDRALGFGVLAVLVALGPPWPATLALVAMTLLAALTIRNRSTVRVAEAPGG